MQTGTVLSWNDKKGWGFIKPQDGGEDRFIHYSQIISPDSHKMLRVGDVVNFYVEMGPNERLQAVRVTVAKKAVA
jgi:cold shock CspA family protein